MKLWKIIIISFLVTLVISFIPIKRNLKVSNECGVDNRALCYQEFATYGFPFIVEQPNIFISPFGSIEYDLDTIKFFAVNWVIYLVLLEIGNLVYKKRMSPSTTNKR